MFSRPVDSTYLVRKYYAEKGRHYDWSIDPDNGFWVPVKDKDGFGQHHGIDFDCEPGTIVRAMADGVIVRAQFESATDFTLGRGLYILQLVNFPGFDSWMLCYSHLKAAYVKPGQRVCRLDAMAESGNSGNVIAPFLHVDLMNLKRQWKPIPLES